MSQRRIVKGIRTFGQKRYMVYLVKSHESPDAYDSWLCGGALVTSTQILTSAACIVDIDNIHAIAGYRKYINGQDIDKDNCTKLMRKKIVKIRVPREHIAHLKDYKNTTQWMTLDIGVATVESPYDFNDVTFRVHCSYIPTIIDINYNPQLEKNIGTSVVALGWGRDRGSKPNDLTDRNSEYLREVSMKIKEKEFCINKFEGNGLKEMIEKYMICTHDWGLLDSEGYIIEEIVKKTKLKCKNSRKQGETMRSRYEDCDDGNVDSRKSDIRNNTLNHETTSKRSDYIKYGNESDEWLFRQTRRQKPIRSRRQAICQNDHGGPLITWIGKKELVIGVAVNSLYDDQFECVGPNLFTSTASGGGQIVRCLLGSVKPFTRRNCGNEDVEIDGYHIIEKNVTHNNNVTNFEFRTNSIEELLGKQGDTKNNSDVNRHLTTTELIEKQENTENNNDDNTHVTSTELVTKQEDRENNSDNYAQLTSTEVVIL